MSVRHRNDYGKIEILDRPLSDCACNGCSRARRNEERQEQPRGGSRGNSRWTPPGSQLPDVGVVAGPDQVVSFKTGGPSGDDTLIADGDYSDDPDGFNGTPGDRGHDHHGPWGSRRRGRYSGPGN